ncbi:MAG TPA: C45 family peptidase [Solirubrobacteraceae bacterium]|nr:C45 family peptidase [Solirubrobacteraceae bacterium]
MVAPEAATPETCELDVTFRSVVAWEPDEHLVEAFASSWPAYRGWFLRDGEERRSSYAECARALEQHMPELIGTYERLVELHGGGDVEARFLSLWNPPPLFAGCSVAAWTGADGPALVRNYDFVPMMCDTTLLASAWNGTRVLAMSDCLWGVLDGVNEHGLAVALAFGGREITGPGFAVTLVLRYVLELCRDTDEAIAAISRIPVNMAYNVGVVDASGSAAMVQLSPDREARITGTLSCGNRQVADEWREYEEFSGTVEREALLAGALADPATTRAALEALFLTEPVYRPPAAHPWGTVYSASYDCGAPAVRLSWPDASWSVPLAAPREEQVARTVRAQIPPSPPVEWRVPVAAPVIVA